VGEEAALAHLQLGREAADREPLEALDGREVGGRLQDRLARAVAAAPAAVGLIVGDGLGARERLEVVCGRHRR
jgi:hypothetical protein